MLHKELIIHTENKSSVSALTPWVIFCLVALFYCVAVLVRMLLLINTHIRPFDAHLNQTP